MSSNLLTTAKAVIHSEAEALTELAATLDQNFIAIVEKIAALDRAGHVIVSGMGKAGLIGSKISATLASVGIPSFFLHPAEALHGDLGRYRPNDIALILSNSGETEEILKTIPAIRTIGCTIIAITATADNSLVKNSDLNIVIGNSPEADKLGLAPTTSTCKMLAVGDALAICLMEKKGISAKEFAFYHPGGNLGRALLKAGEIMRSGDQICIAEHHSLVSEVIKKYSATKGRPGAAIITDENHKLCGIFTDGDLRRCLDQGIDFMNHPVDQHMGKNPKTIKADTLAMEALRTMTEFKIDQILVVDDQHNPVGMIDIQDICFLVPGT